MTNKTINFDKLDNDIDNWLELGIDRINEMPMESVMHNFSDYWENSNHYTEEDMQAFIDNEKQELEITLKKIIADYTEEIEEK